MKQFKNILIIAPFNKQILGYAEDLMSSNQSRLTLMSVVPELEAPAIRTQDGKRVNLQKLLADDVKSDLDQSAAALKEKDFRVGTTVAVGNQSFIEIINRVQTKKHDLVMMLADGISSVRDQLFGTLSMHLMRKCPSAVWVVKPSRRRKFRNVFAAVDPDPEDPVRDNLNIQILKRASTIAQNNRAKLHVIHAWHTLGANLERGRRWMSKQDIRLYIDKVASTHRQRLSQLLQTQLDGTETVHMIQGHPGEVIPQTVSDFKADLLIMGTVCRTGIPGFFIGNTAESILNQVDCSVLTVKPESFVSPVLS